LTYDLNRRIDLHDVKMSQRSKCLGYTGPMINKLLRGHTDPHTGPIAVPAWNKELVGKNSWMHYVK